MFVIKFNDEYYWCGYNKVDTQLRKAVIYKTKKMAETEAVDCLNRIDWVKGFSEKPKIIIWKIVEVELREVK